MANPGGWGSRAGATDAPQAQPVPGGGWGSRATQTTPVAPKKGGGGGFFGGATHWVASKAGLAAHDIKTIPGGIKDMAVTEAHAIKSTVEHPWLHGQQADALKHEWTHPLSAPVQGDPQAAALNLVRGQAKGIKTSFEHPGRDPFQTLLNATALLHGGASGIARAGQVARTGELGAALRPLEPAPRLLHVGDTEVPLHPSRAPLNRAGQGLYDKALQRSLDTNPEGRIAAHAGRRIGNSLAETTRFQTRMREAPAATLERAGKKLDKAEQAALRLVSENSTADEAIKFHLDQSAKGIASKANLRQAKLYQQVLSRGLLTKDASGNVAIDAAKHPSLAAVDAKLAAGQAAVDKILTTHGEMSPEGLQARVNAPGRIRAGARYETPTPGKAGNSPALIKATAERDRLAALHEKALVADEKYHATPKDLRGPMTDEAANARLAELDKQHSELVQKLVPETSPYGGVLSKQEQLNRNYQSGKSGIRKQTVAQEEAEIADARLRQVVEANRGKPVADKAAAMLAERDSLRKQLNARGEASLGGTRPVDLPRGGKQPVVPAASNPFRNRIVQLGTHLEAAQAKVDRLQAASERRTTPTGIVGGEGARPGRGFVSYRTSEPKASRTPMAGASSPVVGKAQGFIPKQAFKGEGLEHGVIPDKTTALVARHMKRAYRYVNTDAFRRKVVSTGSDVRRSSRDVLVRLPDEQAGKISPEVRAILGQAKLTVDEVAGHQAAFTDYLERMIPGLKDKFAEDKSQGIGTPAPEGYRWVDRGVLGDAAKSPAGPRGRIARKADTLNSSVTALTVYFKLGHVGTRVLTNASTALLQGSARPVELVRSFHLWRSLSYEERQAALGAAGQHGFEAMPHEGVNLAGRFATTGAQWWAKHADAPFRFASIAYEARKAGFDTPEKFRFMLDKMVDPSGLTPEQSAALETIAKESNRAGIAYDRLNHFERNYVSRGVWFLPWVKGATVFAGHTFSEHPYKSAVLSNAGVQGRETQQAQLGELPSYEQGLLRLAGHGDHPLVADFSTFSPFATPADVLELAAHAGQAPGFLNPAVGAAVDLALGQDQFGRKTTQPLNAVPSTLTSPTPEFQILNAYLQRHKDQSNRMFHTTWKSALVRSLLGPGTPRHFNTQAGHKAAGREKSGR